MSGYSQSSPPYSSPQHPALPPPQQPTMSGYTQTCPPYSSPQTPGHFLGQDQGQPYSHPQPHPQHQQQPPPSHEYGQPAYPGWRGPYYNAPP
ncbi:hypothetical protein R3W88_011776 [Solanum pinnatisectum]|uniref:Uncharacterized protein n=1 Tax=Solanum pinnatisectum TaxID=50273 RepID=A0AAV9L8F9_9SOLN|nr:hypothetical protein R3W88_011776 [Solanum pinnatisectum]